MGRGAARNCRVTRALLATFQAYNRFVGAVSRREFIIQGGAGLGILARASLAGVRGILISVNAMLDRGAHSGKGLSEREVSLFKYYQIEAAHDFAVSGILFDVRLTEDAYLRQQGYSEIPDKFLVPRTINLFVTDTLGYDIDRDRTGGSSMGPRRRGPRTSPDPFYKTFLGLRDAKVTTLAHEYAHHFTLDTQRNATIVGNVWADLRNDYWLWRQRHGVPIPEFRACVNSEWARFVSDT